MSKSGADVLREFVVAIGFKVDEQQFRSFSQKFEKIADGIGEVAGAVGLATAVIDRNVTVMAARFEKLYYTSQRTGATVKSLQDLEYGAQQIGMQAGAATSQIESMTSALRASPGLQAIFGGVGGDPTKQFITIIEQLKKLSDSGPFGHAQAVQYGAMLGMSEGDLVQYEKGLDLMKQAYAERDKMYRDANLNPDEVAKNSANFGRDLRKLEGTIDVFKALLLERFLPYVDKLVNVFSKVAAVGGKLDVATGGASTIGIGLATSLGAVKIVPMLVRGLLKAFGLGGLAGGGGAAVAAEAGVGVEVAGGGAAAAGASVLIPVVVAVLTALGLGWLLKKSGALDVGGQYSAHSEVNAIYKWFGGKSGSANPATTGDGGIRGNNPGNMRHWAKGQETFERGKSGTFVAFNSAMDGISAMAGQLLRYKGQGIDSISGIVSRWAPKSENDTAAYIARVSKSLGVGATDHLDLSNPGVLQALIHAIIQGEQGRDPYSSSLIQSAVSQRLAREGGHQVSMETTIHVNGGPDPRTTARNVADEQIRVQRDAVRNFLPRTN